MFVLRGGAGVIHAHRPVIFGEFNIDWHKARNVPLEEPLVWARENDYQAFDICGRRVASFSDATTLEMIPSARPQVPDGTEGVLLIPNK